MFLLTAVDMKNVSSLLEVSIREGSRAGSLNLSEASLPGNSQFKSIDLFAAALSLAGGAYLLWLSAKVFCFISSNPSLAKQSLKVAFKR